MKKKALFLTLLISPLFLANSPAPYSRPDAYEDFALKSVTYEASVENPGTYIFSLEVENTGDGYLEMYSYDLIEPTGDFEGSYEVFYEYDYLFVRPHDTSIIKGLSTKQYAVTNLKMNGNGFVDLVETADYSFSFYEFSGQDEASSEGMNLFYYRFNLKYNLPDKEYNYSMMIDYTINGKKYSKYFYDDSELVDITSHEYVAHEDIQFDKLQFIRGRRKQFYGFNQLLRNVTMYGLIFLVGVGFILLGCGITLAIVIPLVILANKEKKERE